jgi:NAD(P)-dependent dehydrogenase (short-subunit alcohol dehydrogenase family)
VNPAQTALITGAARGIGLGLARECARRGWQVVATCRPGHSTAGLDDLRDRSGGAVRVLPLDVADDHGIETLGRRLADESVDFLVNNAAASGPSAGLAEVTYDVWERAMRINVFAILKMTQVFVDHVARSDRRTIVAISSRMGSLAEEQSGGRYAYRVSKAATNMLVKTLAVDLAPRGVTVVSIHPGWVRTSMGGPAAPLSVEDSARGVIAVLAGLTVADSGRFLDHLGRPVPW